MGKKIKYYLRKPYNTLHVHTYKDLYKQINNFLSEQGISSNIKKSLLSSTSIKGTTRNTGINTYGDVDIEIDVWSPEFLSKTEYLRFTIEFDKAKDSLEQRKKADNLVGLLAKYNPKDIITGKKEKEHHLSKPCKGTNFWSKENYDLLFSTIKDYLRQQGIATKEDFRSPIGRHIQGILGDIGIEVYLRRGLRWGSINYDVKFNDSLEERKKADNLIATLAKYNPKHI